MGVKLKERKPGEFWAYINHRGVRRAKKLGTDKRKAASLVKQIEARLAAGDLGLVKQEEKAPTFAEYVTKYLNRKEHEIKASTWEEYKRDIENHMAERFGKLPIAQVSRGAIKDFVLSLQNAGHATKGIKKILAPLRGILREAVDDEVIPLNPALQLGRIGATTRKRPEAKPLTHEELARVLDDAKENEDRQTYLLILTLARTGLRIGEAIALKPSDLDFEAGTIRVERAIRRGRISTPKSGKARTVYATAQLRAELKAWCKERLGANVVPLDAAIDTGWLFSRKGKPMDPDAVRARFKRILARVGLAERDCSPHTLRHGVISYLVEAGKPLTFIQQQAGHSQLATTFGYTHTVKTDLRGELDFLDTAATIGNPDATKAAEG